MTTVLIAWGLTLLATLIGVLSQVTYLFDPDSATGGFTSPTPFEVILSLLGEAAVSGIGLRALAYIPILLALWLILPIVRETPLPLILRRAAVAAVFGLPGVLTIGVIQGLQFPPSNAALAQWLDRLLWGPLQSMVGLVVFLVFGSVIAWNRASRPEED